MPLKEQIREALMHLAVKKRLACQRGAGRIHNAQLTPGEVAEIRSTYKAFDPVFGGLALSAKFGVTPNQISQAARGVTYALVNTPAVRKTVPPKGSKHPRAKLSNEQIALMRSMRAGGASTRALMDKFHVSKATCTRQAPTPNHPRLAHILRG